MAAAAFAHIAGAAAKSDSASSLVSGSNWLPVANRLYLAVVASKMASGEPVVPTVSGNGLNWVQAGTIRSNGASLKITLFRAMKPSGLTSGKTTASFGGTTQDRGCTLNVVEVQNVDSSGTDGAAAIIQVVLSLDSHVNANAVDGTEMQLAAFADGVNNGAFLCHSHAVNEATTPEGTYTELFDAVNGNSCNSSQGEYKVGSGDLTPSCSWSSSSRWAAIAIEVGYALAGPSGLKTADGLAKASVKTMNGLAMASIKTARGLA